MRIATTQPSLKPITSHAVQVIIPRFLPDGRIEIAVMPYTKLYGTANAYTHMRVPTETGKLGETVMATAHRGTFEEAGKDKLFRVKPWGVAYAEFGKDERNPDGAHVKIALVMEHAGGELRDCGKVDDDDADEFHGPMRWVEVQELLTKKVGGYKILGSHGVAICGFLKILADAPDFEAVARMYYNILNHWKGPGLTSQEERSALAEYMARK